MPMHGTSWLLTGAPVGLLQWQLQFLDLPLVLHGEEVRVGDYVHAVVSIHSYKNFSFSILTLSVA